MLRILILCAGLVFAGFESIAAVKLEVMKVGSQVYSNVTISSSTATDVYFSHSKGVANEKLRNLEPSVQKLLNYDAAAAQAAEKRQQEAEQQFRGTFSAASITPRSTPQAEPEESLSDPVSDKSLLGKRVANIEIEKWLGPQPKLEGKFVLVSFWTTKSAAARKWIPQLNALQTKFAEKLQVVGLTSESEKEIQDAPKLEFASAIDPKGRLLSTFGVTTVPYVALIDPKGKVLYYGHPAALNEKHLEAFFARPVD